MAPSLERARTKECPRPLHQLRICRPNCGTGLLQPRGRSKHRTRDYFYKNEVSADRQHAAAVRHSAQWFRAAIFQTLRNTRLFLPPQIFEQFCDFLEANPALCPGWLLFHESYGDFCDNVNDEGQRGDSPDFSHIITAPYVDYVTLDRRMAGYRSEERRVGKECRSRWSPYH